MNCRFINRFVWVAILAIIGCRGPAPEIEPVNEKNLDFLLMQGDKYWETRTEPTSARNAYLFYKQAAKIDTDNQDLMLKYSRACYFLGHYIETSSTIKDSLFKEGVAAGEKGLYLDKQFNASYKNSSGDSTTRKLLAFSEAPIELVPMIYWWCANQGRFLAYKPAIERIKYQEIVETALHRILALNPNYYYGAANRFFGALSARIPGIELSRAYDYFQQAIEKYPDYLGTYTLRAEFYSTKAGNRELFRRDLQTVLNADPTVLPDVMQENMMEQEYAKRLLAREQLLFE